MEEKQLYEDTSSMMRLSQKSKLMKDCITVFSMLTQYAKCLDKRFLRLSRKTISKDYKKGLKQIEKKIPVYVEMSTLKECGPGMYTEVNASAESGDENIVVSADLIPTTRRVTKK